MTMIDQASELRKLVLRSMRESASSSGPPPRLVVMTSGKGGAGVTTLAVNLSVGLAEQGSRVVLVDADLNRSDVAVLCGITEQQNVADVLVARRDIHEVLQRGPAGIQVVPGLWAPGEQVDWSEMAQDRLLRQFKHLGPHADVIVLDVGSGSGSLIRRFCAAADDILLVTAPDAVSVMDAYSRIKSSLAGTPGPAIQLVVNLCGEADLSSDVHRRLDQSCQRFLGTGVTLLGQVPDDDRVRCAAGSAVPFVQSDPSSPAAQAVQQLAARLAAGPGPPLTKAA